ncbi:MAG: hypothetical protein NPIRA03_01610 [Nitrospirales bacterium]|nr:MAG: hypothetical protein NPIRA03_01610 [Nitrospirales bacterium]
MHYEAPAIFNIKKGFHQTSEVFITRLKADGVKISGDGKGRFSDQVFVERLWRRVKYEHV